MNRRWRNLVLPRKRRFDPPWAVVAATPPASIPHIGEPAGWRPRWAPLARRGQFFAVPPAAAVATTPAYIPRFTAPALRQRAARGRRGAFTTVTPSASTALALIEPSGARPRWAAVRRGRFLTVPIAQSAPIGQIEPAGTRARPLSQHRGRFFPVPPLVIATGTGPVIPPITEPAGPRARTYTPRRGTFFQVPLVGLAPTALITAPGFLVSNRPTPLPTRRGLTRWVPPATLGVPDQISPTRPYLRPTRRGRLLWTPPAQSAVTTPWVPDPLSPNRTARPMLVRRGRFWVLAPAPAAAVSTPVVGRIKSRRPTALPTRRGNILDNWAAIVAQPGFVCQDFATSTTITAYSATVAVDAYAATTTVVADSATVSVDTYSGTATNCGR